jgi:hypothetical protein
MSPSIDHSDEFFREQVDQLRAKGHSPEAAADIVAEAMKACSEALQKLLERCENGEPLTEQERPPCGGENEAHVRGPLRGPAPTWSDRRRATVKATWFSTPLMLQAVKVHEPGIRTEPLASPHGHI